MKLITLKRAPLALFFIFLVYDINAQSYFSKRIDIASKINQSGSLLFINDTFFISGIVYEVPYSQVSASTFKVDKAGTVFSAKRFKPSNRSYFGNGNSYYYNHKIYTPGVTDWGYQLQQGMYIFNLYGDTILTRSYGDTVYYNYANSVLPYLKTKNNFLLFGFTDSTCGSNHPGLYKPVLRLVDTNGVLIQTRIYTSTNLYRGVSSADTTSFKGYAFSGAEYINPITKNYVIKLDSNLNQQWYKIIDTCNSTYSSVISTRTGKLIYAHNHTDSSQFNTFFWDRITLTKLDLNGNILWRKRYGNAEKDISVSKVAECANGDFILCGQKYINYTSSANQLVGWLMRTDSSGNLKWWYHYIPDDPVKDTIAQNYLYDVMELPNKDIASVGYVGGSGTFNTIVQTWLLKVDSNGCYQNGCAQAVGIDEHQASNNSIIFQVFPNPFKDEINIQYKLDYYDKASVQLIEIGTGKILYNKQLSVNETNLKLNVKDLISGIYLMSFIKNNDAPVYYKLVNIKE